MRMDSRNPFPAPSGKNDGRDLLAALEMALSWLQANMTPINRLNVFPVPDGDTGTNMFLTMQAGVESARESGSDSAAAVARAAYEGALVGARGNSGVILSQIVRGISVGLASSDVIGNRALAQAFNEAALAGYDAVAEPVEGTMLTVARRAGETALASDLPESDLAGLLGEVSRAARQAVIETPQQLAVLAEANVVDAGGEGVAVIYEGLRMFFAGEELPEGATDERDEAAFAQFAAEHAGDEHGFCTQFLVDGQDLDLEEMRAWLTANADSAVVVGDASRIRVHVHTDMPGQILNYAVPLGTVSRISIENMDLQQADQFAAVQAPEPDLVPPPPAGLVAVAAGEGFARLFADFGATVVKGGQTMNPSVAQIAAAIAAAPTDEVMVLPNNKNIILAAEGAAEVSDKKVHVLASKSVPQGLAAALAYVPTLAADRNLAAMDGAIRQTTSIEVTRAVRDARVNEVEVGEGQYMVLVDGDVVAAHDDRGQALALGLAGLAGLDPEFVSVYWGADASESDAAALEDDFLGKWPEAEFETLAGGQDHYDFVIGIE